VSALGHAVTLEEQIDAWRSYLRRRQAIHSVDVAELEDHLREQVTLLVDAGLTPDEAFLVAVKRMGALDALSREFALEHSERLWKQLVAPTDSGESRAGVRTDAIVAVGLAVVAAVLIKLPALFGMQLNQDAGFYARNVSLCVFPLLTGYFAWKRGRDLSTLRWLAAVFVVAGVFANIYPFTNEGSTELLTALHLPIALWLVVGIAYAGGRWGQVAGRMDFIRFSGELFIYYVLIALGADLQVDRDRPPVLPVVMAAAVRSSRCRAGRLLAGGVQTERDREHGAGVDTSLHSPVRRGVGHVSGNAALDGTWS